MTNHAKHLLTAALLLAAWPVGAAEPAVTVVGEGRARAAPDRARVAIGVVSRAAEVQAAVALNGAQMQQIVQALAALGLADEALATSHYSIHEERQGDGPTGGERVYRVSNALRVELDDLAAVAPAIDAAVRAGANQIGGVEMIASNRAALEAGARARAAAHARAKAEHLARLHGRELGEVLRIAEIGGGRPVLRNRALAAESRTAILPGEQSVVVRLEVVYKLR